MSRLMTNTDKQLCLRILFALKLVRHPKNSKIRERGGIEAIGRQGKLSLENHLPT